MFYYLFYNSSFSFIVDKRLFSTILYGSILYILTHAVLNYCDISILNIINNYFWTIFVLDIISFTYSIYNTFINENTLNNGNNENNRNNGNSSDSSESGLNVSFNLLKNKINTLLDRNNNLTVTKIPIQISEKTNNQSYQSNQSNQSYQSNQQPNQQPNQQTNQQYTQNNNISNGFSTPISQLQNKKQNTSITNNTNNTNNTSNIINTNKASTPISIIRKNSNIIEPFIVDNQNSGMDSYKDLNDLNVLNDLSNLSDMNDLKDFKDYNNNSNESIAGSDVGSIMDLEDFEKSL